MAPAKGDLYWDRQRAAKRVVTEVMDGVSNGLALTLAERKAQLLGMGDGRGWLFEPFAGIRYEFPHLREAAIFAKAALASGAFEAGERAYLNSEWAQRVRERR
jgi:hypothetical protein